MKKIDKKAIPIILILILCGCVVPLLWLRKGGIEPNWDISFHISRFYGMCEELKNGNLLPYYLSSSYAEQGYLTGVFYGWLFLYPFAALTLLGVSVYAAFVSMIFFYNIAFVFITYKVSVCLLNEFISDVSKTRTTQAMALLIAILSAFDPYRIRLLFYRGSIGEWLAMLWVPLIAYSVFVLFQYNRWIPLAFSMAAMCYTHTLSLLIVIVVLIFVFAFQWRRVVARRCRVLRSTVKAASLCLLLSAAFILPFLQSVAEENLLFEHKTYGYTLDGFCFDIVPNNAMGAILGILVVAAFVLWMIFRREPFSRIVQLCCVPFFFYTNVFPWRWLGYTPLSVIQFSWRFMIFMPVLYFLMVWYIHRISSTKVPHLGTISKQTARPLAVVVLVYCVLLTAFVTAKLNVGYRWRELPIITADTVSDADDVGLMEYLPFELAEQKMDEFIHDESQKLVSKRSLRDLNKENVNIYHIDKMTYSFEIQGNDTASVILDKVYYHHLQIYINGKLTAYTNQNGLISIPDLHGVGHICLKYQNNGCQRAGVWITALSVAITLLYLIYSKKSKKRKDDSNVSISYSFRHRKRSTGFCHNLL